MWQHGQTMLCSVDPSGQGGPTYISPGQVALGAGVVVINALLSFLLKMDLHWQLLVGAGRCILQLTVLGYILVPIFSYSLWWLVLLYAFFMLLVGSVEAASRPQYTYKGMLTHITACLGASAGAFLMYTLTLVVRTQPWWLPQYFIPVLGMLLGNAISGVSVGLTTLLEEFSTGRDRVELLLAIGATRWEATRETVGRSVRVACTPILNQMNVVGLVSIPGMMTGQILSGSDPSQAARYQMIVMFVIAATTSVGATAVMIIADLCIVDAKHRLRGDLLHKRDRSQDWSARAARWLAQETGPLRAQLWQAWLYAKFTFLGGAFPGAVEQAGPRDESQHMLADYIRDV